MSSNFTIPIKKRHVLIHVYDHDSGGPRHHDIPALELRLRVYQTATLRSVADAIAKDSQNRHNTAWTVGKILDRDGDEFVDPAETVWGALGRNADLHRQGRSDGAGGRLTVSRSTASGPVQCVEGDHVERPGRRGSRCCSSSGDSLQSDPGPAFPLPDGRLLPEAVQASDDGQGGWRQTGCWRCRIQPSGDARASGAAGADRKSHWRCELAPGPQRKKHANVRASRHCRRC
jgi:hypothetical protein